MAVYRFKVSFEEHDDIVREIDVLSEQTFEDLHRAIRESVQFMEDRDASFYLSNDRWSKGQEIATGERPGHNGSLAILMKDAVLREFINDPHQKIYYVFDYAAQWTFHIELVRILGAPDPVRSYPACVKSAGEAPKQKPPPPQPKGARDEETPEEAEPSAEPLAEETAEETEVAEESGGEAETNEAYFDESETGDLNVEPFGDEEPREFNPDET
jgi:hypothetical protein